MPPEAISPPAPPQYTECVDAARQEPRPTGGDAAGKTARQEPRPTTVNRFQELLGQIDAHPNPAARALLQETLQTLLTFYGDGLARILERVQAGPEGKKIMERLLQDELVSGLLIIHNLHPLGLEERLRGALDKVRPYMQSHGGNIELLGLENDVARVRLEGTCKSCPSSAVTLELAVRRAVIEACPELAGLEVSS